MSCSTNEILGRKKANKLYTVISAIVTKMFSRLKGANENKSSESREEQVSPRVQWDIRVHLGGVRLPAKHRP